MKRSRIIIDSNVHFGKPCVAGTRIPVYTVLELVQAGIPFSEIVSKYYTDLTFDVVAACVQYALDLIKAEEVHLVGAAA
jgi:uncharacterized protein (DUF433 family)